MVFSSVSIVFFFLTAVIALYFILPGRFRGGRNFVLLAFSLFFYACAGLRALPLLLFSVLLDWGSALLLPRCTRVMTSQGPVPLTAAHRRRILAENGRLAERALRVLGFALRQRGSSSDPVEEGLTFLGLAGLYDPPRKEAPAAVAACRAAGVRTVMITGDHVATASAVARQIGIVGEGED